MLKKFLLKLLALFTILCIVLYTASLVLVTPWYGSKMRQGLYNANNNYDAVFLGSSHMNGMLDPEIIYNETNISSFNFGTGGQPINVSYYLLKEILNNNKSPKLVVLDVYYLGLTEPYGEEGYIRYVIDNLKFSKNKIEAVLNCVPRSELISYLFPFFKYHNRWSELTDYDFTGKYDFDTSDNGFSVGEDLYGEDLLSNQSSDIIGEIPSYNEDYLNKIIALSKEYNFDLIFVNAPYDYLGNDFLDNWYPDDAALINRINEVALENNIPFINYSSLEKMNEIDFNFKNDMVNNGHVNRTGATKISYDFADYINKNYNFS